MQYFTLDGTTYRILLVSGRPWFDCGGDVVQRHVPGLGWVDSDLSAGRIRSFGTPLNPEGISR